MCIGRGTLGRQRMSRNTYNRVCEGQEKSACEGRHVKRNGNLTNDGDRMYRTILKSPIFIQTQFQKKLGPCVKCKNTNAAIWDVSMMLLFFLLTLSKHKQVTEDTSYPNTFTAKPCQSFTARVPAFWNWVCNISLLEVQFKAYTFDQNILSKEMLAD